MTLCAQCKKRSAMINHRVCYQCGQRANAFGRRAMKKILKVPGVKGIIRGGR